MSYPSVVLGHARSVIMPGVTEQAGAQRTHGGTDTDEQESAAESREGENAGTDSASSSGTEQTETSQESGSSQQTDSSEQTESSQQNESSEQNESPEQNGSSPQSEASHQEGSSEEQAAQEQPTQETRQPEQDAEKDAPRGRDERSPRNVGELVWKSANVLATVVRVVGYIAAAVLLASIVLTIVGVNVANGVARFIGGFADVAVIGFRDLFLLADPIFAYVVNYGLAAVFWVLVAEFGARLVRWIGARLS